MVCLGGALVAAGLILASYQSRESARDVNEQSVLVLRDIAHLETALSQWFTTVDLFFNAQQSYLASGIERQSLQIRNIVDMIEQQLAPQLEDASVFEVLDTNVDLISSRVASSAYEDATGPAWNKSITIVDDASIEVVTMVETVAEWAAVHAETSRSALERKDLWFNIAIQFSLLNYLLIVYVVWRWANGNIVSPIERLINQTDYASELIENRSEASFDFKLKRGPLEVRKLSDALQDFVDRLQESRQRVQRRNQTIEQQTIELQQQMEALKATRMQLVQSEKMASVGQLAAGVAHEINNPVGFIASNLGTLNDYAKDLGTLVKQQQQCIEQLAENTGDDQKAQSLIDQVLALQDELGLDFILGDLEDLLNESIEGTARVKRIVEDLSEFSHVNAVDKVEENINALLDRTVNLAGAEFKEGVVINKDYCDDAIVIAEGGKLGQLFFNLIANAAAATDEKGTITLRTTVKDNEVIAHIVDDGCGIPEDKLATIFDPFYTTKDIGEGTGLGLHIAQSIARTHGGNLSVSSKEGLGTRFTVSLPVAGYSHSGAGADDDDPLAARKAV